MTRFLSICYFLLLATNSLFTQVVKDTIILTCYNDSLITEIPDTNFIYINNQTPPLVDLTYNSTTEILQAHIMSSAPSFALLVLPNGDEFSFLDTFSLKVAIEGVYTLTAIDLANGCRSITSIFITINEEKLGNGIWRTLQTRSYNPGPNVFGKNRKTISHFINGDTILNNRSYDKLYLTDKAFIPSAPTTAQYLGAIRAANKVIFFQEKSAATERILYDFNIEIGDTVATIFDDVSTQIDIYLASTDTIQTNDNQLRKRYHLRAYYNIPNEPDTPFSTWIEGIGDVELGFLSFPEAVSPFLGRNDFQCFSIDESLVYQNESIPNCFIDEISLDAVDYSPLVLENATWILVNSQDDFTINDYTAYKIQGDTTINNIDYKKLLYYELEKTGETKFQILTQSIAGYLREDIAARKVYIRFIDNSRGGCFMQNEDHLLLDFSKIEGEEFDDCHVKNKQIQESLTITQDTIIEIFGQHRRVLTNGGIRLIEGIGYDEGLFNEPTSVVTQAASTFIFDYCVDNNFNCNLLTNTKEPLRQKVNIFPNPTANLINLQLTQPLTATIALKTLTGQTVYQADFNGGSYQIPISDLSKGVYMLHLQSKEGYLMQKIIIQ